MSCLIDQPWQNLLDLAETERGGRRDRRPPRKSSSCLTQRLLVSVAFVTILTVDCQLSSVAFWVRLTISENCSTASRLPFRPRSNRPRPASIAAFCASNAVLSTDSLWVDQVPSRSRPKALLSSAKERAASIEALAVSVPLRAAWAAMRVASVTAAAADSGISLVVVDIEVLLGLLSGCVYLRDNSRC